MRWFIFTQYVQAHFFFEKTKKFDIINQLYQEEIQEEILRKIKKEG